MRRKRTERIAPQPSRKNADLKIQKLDYHFHLPIGSRLIYIMIYFIKKTANLVTYYMNWANARGFDDIFFFSSGLQAPVNQKR